MAQSIPYEIQMDILSRVPGKSLIRFRGACKRWRDTIDHDLRPAPFALASLSQTRVRVYAFHDAKNAFSLTREFAWDDVRGETNTVLPSCGAGLVCCHGRRDVLVLNPSIADRLALPRSDRTIMGCGFGYSRSLDEYKVVRFVDCKPDIQCEVFTLGADDAWRPVEAFKHPIVFNHHRPVCVDGRIHWIGINMHSKFPIIVGFDLETERFTAVDGPRWLSRLEVNGDNLDLRVLEARLCMVKRMPSGRGLKKVEGRQRVEVWVMVSEGNWSRKYVFGLKGMYQQTPEVVWGDRALFRDGRRFYRCSLQLSSRNCRFSHLLDPHCSFGSVHVDLDQLVAFEDVAEELDGLADYVVLLDESLAPLPRQHG